MAKGCYTVGENPPAEPPRTDNSFRSFLCALLIFLVLCLIILFASLSWGTRSEGVPGGGSLAHKGEKTTQEVQKDEREEKKPFERIEMYDETTRGSRKEDYFKEETEDTTEEDKLRNSNSSKREYDATTVRIGVENTEATSTAAFEEGSEDDKIRSSKQEYDITTKQNKVGAETTQQTSTPNFREESENSTEEDKVTSSNNSRQEYVTTTERVQQNETTEEPSDQTTTSLLKAVTEDTETPTFLTKLVDLITSSTTKDVMTVSTTEEVSAVERMVTNLDEVTTDTTVVSMEPNVTEDVIVPTTIPKPSTIKQRPLTTAKPTQTPSAAPRSTTEITIVEYDATEPSRTDYSSALVKAVNPVCGSATCKAVASRMLSTMDHSVEPCDDFYEFACGRAYEIEEESPDSVAAKLLEENLFTVSESHPYKFLTVFKNFYQSCLNHENFFSYSERMKGVQNLVDEVGKFHLRSSEDDEDFTDLVSALILRQSMPLFDIAVDVDKSSSNFILQLNLPQQSFLQTDLNEWSGLRLVKLRCLQEQERRLRRPQIELDDVYKLYQNCQGNYTLYLDSVEAVIRELKAFSSLGPDELRAEIKDIRFTIEFEVLNSLDTLPSSAEILGNFVKKNYEIRRVYDLQQHFPILQWKKMLATLTGHQVEDNSLVQVYFADYFKNVFSKLKRVDKRKLNNAFLAIYSNDLYLNTVVPRETGSRDSFCTALSKKLLPDVWSYFVSVTTPKDVQTRANKKITEAFGQLKTIFCASLKSSSWVDGKAKDQINRKCDSLSLALFESVDHNALEKRYVELNVTEDYQTNLMTLLMNFKRMVLSTEGTHLSDNIIFSYFLDPLSTKPLTFYANPVIAVPFGIIQRAPSELPDYLIQSRLGFPIARQLARHFDPTGIQYNVTLTAQSESSYSEFVITMMTSMQYSSPRMFLDKNISFALNGNLTNSDRIVDNTAFRLVFDSLKFTPDEDLLPWISSQFSREKVFFISVAQEYCKKTSMADFMLQVFEQTHLPAVLRVENIVGTSQQFSSEFTCPDGSPMVLQSQVQFPYIPFTDQDEYAYEDGIQNK